MLSAFFQPLHKVKTMSITTADIKSLIDAQHQLPQLNELTEAVELAVHEANENLSYATDEAIEWDIVAVAHTPTKKIKVSVYSGEFVDFALNDLGYLNNIEALSIELHCKITWNGHDGGEEPIVFTGATAIETLEKFQEAILVLNDQGTYRSIVEHLMAYQS